MSPRAESVVERVAVAEAQRQWENGEVFGDSHTFWQMCYLQDTDDFSVEVADLAGSIIQSQYLGVAVAVAVIGYLPSEEGW